MDPIMLKIIDILRRGKENQALNAGGPTAGAQGMQLPQATSPAHAINPGGNQMTPEEYAAFAETGRR